MKTAQITKLIFIPTGSYQDMAVRPYSVERAVPAHLDQLEAATDGFANLTAGAMAGIAGQILRPTSAPQGTLSIENGWNQRRFMFMMEVVHASDYDHHDSSVRIQYVTGMTSHAERSLQSGFLDPHMNLYIDKVINTRELRANNTLRRRGIGANYYLSPSAPSNGSYANAGGGRYSMRPRDICNQIGNTGFDVPIAVDYRNNLASRPVLSNVRNDLAADYLSRTVSSYRQAVNMPDAHQSDMPDLMYKVSGLTEDAPAMDDVFIQELIRNTELCEGQSMSYGEFCRLFPDAPQVARVVEDTSSTMTRDIGFASHNTMDTKGWGGSGNDTVTATILASALPALMHESLLTMVSFFITNDTINGQPEFEWLAAPMSFMNSGDLQRYADNFRTQVIHHLFPGMTMNNNLTISLSAHSDLAMADTRLEMSIDNGPNIPYAVPNFVGSMITPVLANQMSQVGELSSSIHAIFKHMQPAQIDIPEPDAFGEHFTAGERSLGSVLRQRDQQTQTAAPAPASSTGWKL